MAFVGIRVGIRVGVCGVDAGQRDGLLIPVGYGGGMNLGARAGLRRLWPAGRNRATGLRNDAGWSRLALRVPSDVTGNHGHEMAGIIINEDEDEDEEQQQQQEQQQEQYICSTCTGC